MARPFRAARTCVRAALVCTLLGAGAAAQEEVAVRIDSPAPGAGVSGMVHQARIEGSALAHGAAPRRYDVMLAIDASYSTRVASGGDVDGDGLVGVDPHNELLPPGVIPDEIRSTDPQDTVLHAQAAAARSLLADLDPRRVRVGVLSYSGDVDPTTGKRKHIEQQDAWLEAPLTTNYEHVRNTLRSIVARGPHGATNFAAGVRLAMVELAALTGAVSPPRPDAEKVILFLSDGKPTLPIGKGSEEDPGDIEAAIRSAMVARKAGIVVNTYALGDGALLYPRALTEMARVSRGTYTPVQNPGDIVALLGGVTFADVEDVIFANVTTGELSTDVRLNPDGSFTGYVPVREGENRVRVIALASDGRRGASEFDFEFEHQSVGSRDDVAELERIRRQNRDLELHRRRLEIEAFRADQRRTLTIDVEAQGDREAEEPGAAD